MDASAGSRFALPSRLARLFRFRLLTVLVIVTVICAWLAYNFHREPISQRNVAYLRQVSEMPRDIFKVVYSPDRRRVAFVAWEQPVDVREAITLWPVRTIGNNKKIIDFAFSPDSRRVAYCENTSQVELFDLKSGQALTLGTGNPQPSSAFSPDGSRLATSGYGTEARVWDAATGQLLLRLDAGRVEGGLRAVFSPDGRTIAVGNRNSVTRLFDAATGRMLHELPKASSQELHFDPSGNRLAVAYVDGSIGLWEVATGQLLAMQASGCEEVYTLDWSPDGSLLASGGLNGPISLWDLDLEKLHSLAAPEWVVSVKFSPDGSRLITGGGSRAKGGPRSVVVWGVPPMLWRSRRLASQH
jgi:WD40 repeat protein